MIFISFAFTLAIAIFGLIEGSVQQIDQFIGCQSKYSGIMSLWQNVDDLMILVDQNFCSTNCPCTINNPAPFLVNASVASNYAFWTKVPAGGATAFQNCSYSLQKNAESAYNASHVNDTINITLFEDYFNAIETKFNCSGWCQTSYYNNGANETMYKYLYTDINRYLFIFYFLEESLSI